MPPLFMYSIPEKLSATTVVSPAVASPNASASTGSANAVTSPEMSMTLTPLPASRTDICTFTSAMIHLPHSATAADSSS